jgi:hypothetical protein
MLKVNNDNVEQNIARRVFQKQTFVFEAGTKKSWFLSVATMRSGERAAEILTRICNPRLKSILSLHSSHKSKYIKSIILYQNILYPIN